MTLDLQEMIGGWDPPEGELAARMISGRDGGDVVQLRVELGLMQMFPDGRPDAARYHGHTTALEFVEHQVRCGRPLSGRDWQELERELLQTNYRRMAFTSLAERALGEHDESAARSHLSRAMRDITACLDVISLFRQFQAGGGGGPMLRPALLFQHTRLAAQALVLDGRYHDAVDSVQAGYDAVDDALTQIGFDEGQRERDPSLEFLRGLIRQLRQEYSIAKTLRERLDEALANEDFELAARLRDELNRRPQ